jgi:hypothetical protein
VYYHVTILFAYSVKQDNLMLTVCEWHDENSILTTTVSSLKTVGVSVNVVMSRHADVIMCVCAGGGWVDQ